MKFALYTCIAILTASSLITGLGMVIDNTGAILNLSLPLLDQTPFHNYQTPGILLISIVGIPGTLTLFKVINKKPQAHSLAFGFSLIVCFWVILQLFLVPGYSGISLLFLTLGILSTLMSMQVMGKKAV